MTDRKKIVKWIFAGFSVLYLIAWIYFDFFLKLQSIYWLATKAIFICTFFPCLIFIRQKSNNENKVTFSIVILLNALLLISHLITDVGKYKTKICQDKFGMEFNKRRLSLGVPIIPEDWKINEQNEYHVEWKQTIDTIGHISKVITTEADCSIDRDVDYYNFKPVKGVKRKLIIRNYYPQGEGKDTISYDFYCGKEPKELSRKQADSLFTAEKLNKDY